ncbi:unnamed protein product [Mucor circinelloides]
MANLGVSAFLKRLLLVGAAKLENKNIPLFKELMVYNVCSTTESLIAMVNAGIDVHVEERFTHNPENKQEQEQEQEQEVQVQEQEIVPEPTQKQESPSQKTQDIDYIPHNQDYGVFNYPSVEETISDEESTSPDSWSNDLEHNNDLYAANHEIVGNQNQYASSNQNEVPEAPEMVNANNVTSNETNESELERIGLTLLTPTTFRFNDTLHQTHANKNNSTSQANSAFNDATNPQECTQNNVAMVNSLDVAAVSTATPSTPTSSSTDSVFGVSLPAIHSLTPLPIVINVPDKNKEISTPYTSTYRRKHGRSLDQDEWQENAPKQRKLEGSMSVNGPNVVKISKPRCITPRRQKTGLSNRDNNRSAHHANRLLNTASQSTPRTNTSSDIENQPIHSVGFSSGTQQQPTQQYISNKIPSQEASLAKDTPPSNNQQNNNNNSAKTTWDYTTVSYLGKKRTRHERDEYDFYSDYHEPVAKRFFDHLLDLDPF